VSCESPEPCELLPWDTEFFKCRIAKVYGDTLDQQRASQIESWSRSSGIECLYFLSRSGDPLTIRTAEAHGFGLMDIRLTLENTLEEPQRIGAPTSPAKYLIRAFAQRDLERVQAIARVVHNNTRFFNDPHFARQRVEDFYAFWIAQECGGGAQQVLVAGGGKKERVGYISCYIKRNTAAVRLLRFDGHQLRERNWKVRHHEARGNGVGVNLILAAKEWFLGQGIGRVAVVTQGSNRPAQRVYQRCGFLTQEVQLWYHKWYPPQRQKNV